MVQALVQERQSASQQWSRALDRAVAESLDILVEPISGAAFVESASTPGTLYAVSADSCSCPAGQHGMPCKHRACYLVAVGAFPIDAPASCLWCNGSGRTPNDYQERYDPCDRCSGAGVVVDTDIAA